MVKAREATLFAKKKPPNDADFKVKSAALWREIAEPDPTGAQFSRLRYWMRTCVFGLTADAAGAALVATLCGCWWAAPTGRLLTPEGDIVPSVCGACGAESGCRCCSAAPSPPPRADARPRARHRAAVGACERAAWCLCADMGQVECASTAAEHRRRRRLSVVAPEGAWRAAAARLRPRLALLGVPWRGYRKRPK